MRFPFIALDFILFYSEKQPFLYLICFYVLLNVQNLTRRYIYERYIRPRICNKGDFNLSPLQQTVIFVRSNFIRRYIGPSRNGIILLYIGLHRVYLLFMNINCHIHAIKVKVSTFVRVYAMKACGGVEA
jgi:hypothetical protein